MQSSEQSDEFSLLQYLYDYGVPVVANEFFEVTINTLGNDPDLLHRYVLAELDGASGGSDVAQAFVQASGMSPEEYSGALMREEHPAIDGPEGAQQIMNHASLSLMADPEKMLEFRLTVADRVMRHARLGKYSELNASTSMHGASKTKRRLAVDDGEVEVFFVIRNGELVYRNDTADELFSEKNENGVSTLDGRAVSFMYLDQKTNDKVEIIAGFKEEDSYMMFTVGANRDYRLNLVSGALFQLVAREIVPCVFSPTGQYATEHHYIFHLYKKEQMYFAANTRLTMGHLVTADGVRSDSVEDLRNEFWGS